jgi:hypothetical protein
MCGIPDSDFHSILTARTLGGPEAAEEASVLVDNL